MKGEITWSTPGEDFDIEVIVNVPFSEFTHKLCVSRRGCVGSIALQIGDTITRKKTRFEILKEKAPPHD